MIEAKITAITPSPLPPHDNEGWASVATHSHMLRSHTVDFETAKRNLVEWAHENHVDAVGVGSPWEPMSEKRYLHYETVGRDAYFGGRVPPKTMMNKEAIAALIQDLNDLGKGRTHFYLDNETPKNRHGHLWYVGFDYQVPGWHDYNQDQRVQFWDGDRCEDPNMLTDGCHRRRSYAEIIAQQRQAGALGIWAHPTSWWTEDGTFITNIAAEMITHAHADGFLDGMVVQGYDAYHLSYQTLWFDLLDRGLRVPGYAELDASYDQFPIAAAGTFLNYVPTNTPPTDVSELIPPLRAARHYISSGPHLTLMVDGQPMGAEVISKNGHGHHAVLTAWPAAGEQILSRVEFLGYGGTVLAHVDAFPGGTIECELTSNAEGGYILCRAFGEHDNPSDPRQQRVRHCALTNPIFLNTPKSLHHVSIQTQLTLNVPAGSAAAGGRLELLNAEGDVIESGELTTTGAHWRVNPNWRLRIEQTNGMIRDIPIAMANSALREQINYLADGGFYTDNPSLAHGEVPVSAFRFDQIRQALAKQTLSI